MAREHDHLAQRNGVAVLKDPDDPRRPTPNVAPFDLNEATPLDTSLGAYLTSPSTVRSEDSKPSIVLEHSSNPELSAWVTRHIPANMRYREFFVLTCHGPNRTFYYKVPKKTVESVLQQAMESSHWGISSLDDELLEAIIDEF